MPRSRKPAGLEDQLDAVLDGRHGPVPVELVPPVQAAEALRATCARMELDPAAGPRHLAQALSTAPDELPADGLPAAPGELAGRAGRAVRAGRATRDAGRRRRRRVAAFALAAAAVLTLVVTLAGNALPGEPLYPVKLTVENARLTAAHWSPRQRADLRTNFTSSRLHELDSLVGHGRVDQIPTAIAALDGALVAAQRAEGAAGGGPGGDQRLRDLRAGRTAELTSLVRRLPSTTPAAARVKIEGAVQRSLSGTTR